MIIKLLLCLVPDSLHWKLKLYIICDPLAERINKLREGRIKFDLHAAKLKLIEPIPSRGSIIIEYFNYLVETYNELVKQYNLIMG